MGCGAVKLLDTHALLWLITGDAALGENALAVCDEAQLAGDLGVCAISWWEIGMLRQKGRIHLTQTPTALRHRLMGAGLLEIALDGETGIAAAEIESFHGDPADRIITVTAQMQGACLVTADQKILDWEGALNRLDARQ